MDNLTYTVWIIKQALSGLFYLLPVTLLILVLTIIVGAKSHKKGYSFPARHVIYMVVPVIGIILTTTAGVLFRNQDDYIALPTLGFILTLSLALIAIFKTKQWLLAGAVECLIVYIAYFFWFISAMSVSGDWL